MENHKASASYMLPFLVPFIEEAGVSSIWDQCSADDVASVAASAKFYARPIFRNKTIISATDQPSLTADLAISRNVLECTPEAELDEVLKRIKNRSRKAIFVISSVLSDVMQQNGENLHCTVRPASWWRDLLEKHFANLYEMPEVEKSGSVFTTWTPGFDSIAKFQGVRRAQAGRNKRNKRIARVINETSLFLKPAITDEDLLSRVRGKTVAIVGNASSLREKPYGAEIDAHDVIIRFNGALIPNFKSHGSRTDWMASAFPIDKPADAKVILWMTLKRKSMSTWMTKREGAEFYMYGVERHDALAARLGGARPSSGARVIHLLASEKSVKKISIYGFDFYATPTVSDGRTIETSPHDFYKEKILAEELIAQDERVVLRR